MKFVPYAIGLLALSALTTLATPTYAKGSAGSALVTHSSIPASLRISQFRGEMDTPELRRERAVAFLQDGIEYARAGQYPEALNTLERALSSQPDMWQAYYARGIVWLKLGENVAALQDFTAAIRFNPNHGQSYFNLAVIFRRLGDIPAAYNNYVRSAEIYQATGQMADYQEALNAIERLRR